MKRCKDCGETKPLSAFGTSSRSSDGHQIRCRPCLRVHRRRERERMLSSLDAEKFWSLVVRRQPDECWWWNGKMRTCNVKYTPMTYGVFLSFPASRISWILANGRQPKKGHVICHRCDQPLCVNPSHLFEGTRGDNQRDMQEKLRSGILGTKNPKARLTPEQVMEIRASDETDTALGRKYGVWPTTIRDARSGRRWRFLPGARPEFYTPQRKVPRGQYASIKRRREAGESLAALAEEFGISTSHAATIAKYGASRPPKTASV